MAENTRFALFAACVVMTVFLVVLSSATAEGSPDGNLTIIAYTHNGGEVLKMGSRLPKIVVAKLSNESWKTSKNSYKLSINVTDGTYRVEIYWMGQLVFNDTVSVSNNTVLVKANCTVGRVRFFVKDDEDHRVTDTEVVVKVSTSTTETIEEGESILLPFGKHTVSKVIYSLKLQDKNSLELELQPVEGKEFTVEGDSDVVVKIPIRHSVKLSFFKLGNVPLTGANYRVKVLLVREGRKHLLKELVLSSNEITLGGVPYGDYTVRVYRGDEVLLEKSFSIDKNVSEVKLEVNIIAKIRMIFVDLDNRPLTGFNLTLSSPDGEKHSFILDDAGALFLFDTKPGVYTYSVIVNGIEVKGRVDVSAAEVSGGALEKSVRVPVRYVLVKIVDKGGAGIPPGLTATLRYGSLLISNISVAERSKTVIIDAGYLPTDKNYELAVVWEGAIIVNRTLSGPCEIDVFFKDVKIVTVSKTKRPLVDALVEIRLHNGSLKTFKCSSEGIITVPYAVGGYTYTVKVFWKGVKVAEKTFNPENLEENVVGITADIGSVLVEVKGWFDKPIRGALVNLTLKMFNGSILLLTTKTDNNGVAQFPFVPLAGTGVERALLSVRYGRFGPIEADITADLTEPIIKKQLRLDVVELADGLALSMLETVGVAVTLAVTSVALLVVYRKLVLKKELESMLTESSIYAYREARRRWTRSESFFERLKERLSMLKGGEFEEEEEEEWGIFD